MVSLDRRTFLLGAGSAGVVGGVSLSTDGRANSQSTDGSDTGEAADWSQYRFGPGNTGYTPASLGLADPPSAEWETNRPGRVAATDELIVVDGPEYVHGLDPDSGTEQWRYEHPGTPVTPAVHDGTVYAGGGEMLRALDADTGDIEWCQFRPGEDGISAPTVAEDAVFVTADGTVEAWNVDGSLRWRVETDPLTAPVAVADGTVYAVGQWHVYAFDAADGTERWRVKPDDESQPIVDIAPVATDGRVFVSKVPDRVVTFDADDGSQLELDARTEARTVPAVTDEYLSIGGFARVNTRHLETDELAWRSSDFEDFVTAGPIVAGDRLYVGVGLESSDYAVYAYDLHDGTLAWSHGVDSVIGDIVASDALYVSTENRLFALG